MTRERALRGARAVFVVLTLACAWWGFRGRWDEVGSAMAATGPARLAASVGCVAVGLLLTGLLWRLLLARLGSEVTTRQAGAVFFVGQLGKYVPGSVWSLAVQADLGRRYDVPVRRSVTASALFLLVHTATGLLVGGVLALGGAFADLPEGPVTSWPVVVTLVGGVVLLPPVLRRAGDLLAGHGARTIFTVVDLARVVVLMAAVWTSYGIAVVLLAPDGLGLGAAVAAFALAHAAGVLFVVAPAGVGAREAVLVALLAPVLGVPGAAAAAVLLRVAHALADFLVAGAAAAWGRWEPRPTPIREPAGVHGQ
ncbi:uncharacterized membrane protein YbhN (UPF0104 family) [Nocardioides sp. BE266]|uniref:lysylphosphatidylglycerol synthase domain-containing protein n=1 Tax=Nocardioides sp. BE266 TaxID=2817725 RepID=UPI00285D2DC1|nr:lysylphosphatidylglycerol synthase domain-containing protein [Nocardioides sp. BE266]MDR7255362.1 uncharacterized membrane protein YbhN (UPF0104 family) [Nocardioides sp. BE266]